MLCIGRRRQHRWDRGVWTHYDERQRFCLDCGLRGVEFTWEYHAAIHEIRVIRNLLHLPCAFCREEDLRKRAWDEQAPIRAALRADEDEVLALYGRKSNSMNRYTFAFQTPQKAREEFPAWQQARAARQATAKQRAHLRQGQQTLTAIRQHLRAPGRSPLRASRPARTSPTS